jgi:hypothetical protein
MPGQLGAPTVNIINPPDEPDPQGMSAVLAAIQNGNMFRDMSGLNSTIGFAQSAMTRAFDAARDAAAQAGENAKTAADVLKTMYAKGGVSDEGSSGTSRTTDGLQSPRTISNAGSRINYGEKLDQKGDSENPYLDNGTGNGATSYPFGTGQVPFGGSQSPMATQAFMTDLGTSEWPTIQRTSWPSGGTSSSAPQRLLSGDAATSQAAQMLSTAQPITLPNGAPLRPGTIWNDSSMLIAASEWYVYYLKDGDLYEWNPYQFMRAQDLTGWMQGVSSASTLVYLADVEISLLAGIFVGPAQLVAATIVDSGLKLYHNRTEARAAYQAGWKVVSALNCIRTNSPELWTQLQKATFQAIVDNAPTDVSMKTVAFWLGRIMRGVSQAAPDITFAGLAAIVAKVTAIITAIHTPGLVGRALDNAIAARVAELKSSFSAQGIQISTDDAKALMHALNSNDEAMNCISELKGALDDLRPVMRQLVPHVLQ